MVLTYFWAGGIVWAIIWGFAARAIVLNKGYEYEGTKWFWLGFFFSIIAVIIAATKPENKPQKSSHSYYHATSEKDREQEMLDNGGWRCVCGRVNYNYVSSCGACNRSRREGDVRILINRDQKNEVKEPSIDTNDAEAIKAKITEFKNLLDEGFITQEEFEAKRKQLLGL